MTTSTCNTRPLPPPSTAVATVLALWAAYAALGHPPLPGDELLPADAWPNDVRRPTSAERVALDARIRLEDRRRRQRALLADPRPLTRGQARRLARRLRHEWAAEVAEALAAVRRGESR